MNKRNMIDVLQEDVVIPDVVRNKADAAFDAIRSEPARLAANSEMTAPHKGGNDRAHKKNGKKKYLLIVLAAALVFGSVHVAAAYLNRSKSLTGELHISEEQHVQMEDSRMSSFVNQSSTVQDITVTAIQCITDNYYTHIAFRVEGYQASAGIQPDFESIRISVDGHDSHNSFENSPIEDNFNYNASFYNGLVSGPDGRAMNDDGTPVQLNADGSLIENYTLKDGTMEYCITLSNTMSKGFFIGKPIHVELKNLGAVKKAEFQPDIEGTWSFDWTLKGSSDMRECQLNTPLGDSGADVVKAELSPISLRAEYQFPRRDTMEKGIDENGGEITVTTPAEPPRLTGVRMKDGTVYPYLYLGPGSQGYVDNDSGRYYSTFAIDRVINVEQVESLLFAKPYEEGRGESIDENFYIVPLK